MKTTHWARLLTYVSGLVNQELLLRNEYLAAENCILRAHLLGRLRLPDPERATLSEIGKRLGRKALEQIACVAKPDTILGWYWKLAAQKFGFRLTGTFNPSRRQMRCTRSLPTFQPDCRSNGVMRRTP